MKLSYPSMMLALLFLISFSFYPAPHAFASPTYQLKNNLPYPVTIDIYRVYWKRDIPTKPVLIEKDVQLDPETAIERYYSNDDDIEGYIYKIQCFTKYYSLSIPNTPGNHPVLTSKIIHPDNAHSGLYRFPPIL